MYDIFKNFTTYEDMLACVLKWGDEKGDRTGTGTRSCFGLTLALDMDWGFPIVTTKKVAYKSAFKELLWFLSGDTNNNTLKSQGVTIWDEWAKPDGSLGKIYGYQFIKSGGINQVLKVENSLRNDPNSRRHIINLWNVQELDEMALPPCPCFFQFNVINGDLSLNVYQRSADIFLGVPFNIAQYALFLHMTAYVTGLKPATLKFMYGDIHLYKNHTEQAEIQINRPMLKPPSFKFINHEHFHSTTEFSIDNIIIEGYQHGGVLKGDVSV